MDLATVIGIVGGLAAIVWGINLEGSITAFLDFPSAVIVFGGVVAAILVNYPMSKLADVFHILKKAFIETPLDAESLIQKLVSLAETARRDGLLALEDEAYQLEDEFLRNGILLIVDGTDPELVKNILETELSFLEDRHREGQEVFETMGSLAPSFGLIGTVIGLINMLKSLDDPDAIGPGMAVALVTTFYGAVFANLLFLPIAGKLKVKSREEILLKEVMIEGMLSIQAGENPRIIEEKLKAFLSPKIRKHINETNLAESGEDFVWQQASE